MSILGSLDVNLVANTKRFTSNMLKAEKRVKTFGGTLKNITKGVVGAGLAGGGMLAVFTKKTLDEVDELAKTSRRLGLTTEALGAYQFAAKLSGMETSTLTTSLERMRDTIGAAGMGEKGALGALESLGLSVEKLTEMDDPLAAIQESISKIGDQNRRTAVIRDIFGRGGSEMLNLFENNLRGVRKEYEAMGAAVSGEEAKRIENLNDNMTRALEKLKGAGRRFVVDATPALVRATNTLSDWMDKVIGSGKSEESGPRHRLLHPAAPAKTIGGRALQWMGSVRDFYMMRAGEHMLTSWFENTDNYASDAEIRARQMRAHNQYRIDRMRGVQ